MDIIGLLKKREELESEIQTLKNLLEDKERSLENLITAQKNHTLTNSDVNKYSRQIIVPTIGVRGQEKIKNASVLIIGCGGLGCPAAQYLAGCGIGRIGLVDYDDVEENNLHRQVLHSEETIGFSKVDSVGTYLNKLNSSVKVEKYHIQLDSNNSLEIISKYDIVLDASDNVATRYLINDACVISNRPLISGSSVRMEGQLTIYNYKGGPCYRCLFPQPPPPSAVSNCGDVGVLGPVPGVIGVLQALQAIHIILENDGHLSRKLLMFDGMETCFRTIILRKKNINCSVCGENSTPKLIDYEQFCRAPANDKNPSLQILKTSQRIKPQELLSAIKNNIPHVVVDVRSPLEFEICNIPGSINIPLDNLSKPQINNHLQELLLNNNETKKTVYVVCRRGNDSQIGATKLIDQLNDTEVLDLKGGLHAWANEVDPTFPVY